ncbi:uncharacterized protein LOC116601980 [Nematostella vectensis]|uniref:uncharacterized protein LOC116601980 n=1 Tax=Nematostella vectensis TaxID=45351 RepID=UPI002077182A|nr:uncharacterized protein LOC116601980 [Nematostella vectensis]
MAVLQVLLLAMVICCTIASEEIKCRDLMATAECQAAVTKEEGLCYKPPWNSQCRRTCGRCNVCYDAENDSVCDSLKHTCSDDEATAHRCSLTCGLLGCEEDPRIRRVYHSP